MRCDAARLCSVIPPLKLLNLSWPCAVIRLCWLHEGGLGWEIGCGRLHAAVGEDMESLCSACLQLQLEKVGNGKLKRLKRTVKDSPEKQASCSTVKQPVTLCHRHQSAFN